MAAPALRLVLTEAGIARFTAAQFGQPIDLSVASVGLSAAQIAVAPTLTALPGEFRRVATVSGKQVGRDVAHLIVRDEAPLAYQVRAVGLFLADGTLFAVYGQPEPIVGKSTVSTLLLALDIAFPANSTAAISFGNTDFLNPPATEQTAGVMRVATQADAEAGTPGARAITAALFKALFGARKVMGSGLATGGGTLAADRTIDVAAASAAEVDEGAVTNKAVTPAGLVNVLASILQRVPLTRRIDTDGLALGGGALGTDRTISVPAATGAQIRAGGASNAAATPKALADAGAVYVVEQLLQQNGGYRIWSDGLKECWGQVAVAAKGTAIVGVPVAHSSWLTPASTPTAIAQDEQMLGIENLSVAGFTVRNNNPLAAVLYWQTKGV